MGQATKNRYRPPTGNGAGNQKHVTGPLHLIIEWGRQPKTRYRPPTLIGGQPKTVTYLIIDNKSNE